MAATVRELVTKVGIQTDKAGIEGAKRSFGGLKTAIVAAAAIIGSKKLFGAFVTEVTKLGDELDKTSRQLGISSTSLQELRFAAGQSGIGASETSEALRKLQKNAFEASTGNKTLAEDFEKLGVSVTDANGNMKPTEQLFEEVAEGMSKVESEAAKTGIAMSLMGRSGGKMIPLFEGGAAGIQEMREESQQLGGVMSKQLIKDSADLTDSFARISQITDGLRNAISSKLIPATLKITEAFVKWFKANRELIVSRLSQWAGDIARVIGSVVSVIGRAATSTIGWFKNLSPLQGIFLKIAAAAAVLALILFSPVAAVLALIALVGLIIDDFETWRKGGDSLIGDLIGGLGDLESQFPNVGAAVRAVGQTFVDIFTATQNLLGSFIAFFIELFTEGPTTAINNLGMNVRQVFTDLFGEGSFMMNLLDTFAAFFGVVFGNIVEQFRVVGEVLGTIFGGIVEFWTQLLQGNFLGAFNAVKEAIIAIFESISGAVSRQFDRLTNLGKKVGNLFGFGGDDEDSPSLPSPEQGQLARPSPVRQIADQAQSAAPALRSLSDFAVSPPEAAGIPAVAAPSGVGGQVVNAPNNNISVTVDVPAGLNEEQVAKKTAEQIEIALDRQNRSVMEGIAVAAPAES